jgi:hypothetical protein
VRGVYFKGVGPIIQSFSIAAASRKEVPFVLVLQKWRNVFRIWRFVSGRDRLSLREELMGVSGAPIFDCKQE